MIGRFQWVWRRMHRSLWYRASLYSLAGVVTALIAWVATPWLALPEVFTIGARAVDSILDIIASSMLAVTTFSLSAMVTAYGSATSNVSPRATLLLIEDRVTQNTLATFIGAFLFSLVGIVALAAGIYDADGRTLLFAATLVVIVLVVYQLIKWAGYLTRLGRVRDTIGKVESAASAALGARIENPYLGGEAMPAVLPSGLSTVRAGQVGYVQHIDTAHLGSLVEDAGEAIYVQVLPGSFVDRHAVLAASAKLDEARIDAIQAAFTIGPLRHFDQDPRFGLIVMAEVASRALSPGINDPGTAIDAIGCAVRTLTPWVEHATGGIGEPESPVRHVHVEALSTQDLFDDFFTPVARDGAGSVEVCIRLQKALRALAVAGDVRIQALAREHMQLLVARCEHAMPLEADRARVKALLDPEPARYT
ncbi:DUF2254 domain-containing protein [Salinicola endophyticus]|uniref:DUF2254 domain-containing protein n=1 Tax=Salinicola endophyticus TaxID=1949083 RepID=A0ABY8FBF0_9GAMM|nr:MULTISPECIES: DUF2254 domain-containing protein [Salinicola]WFF40126.1 DUF2254 domain-containing protein [Salinicola endophyticus]